MKNGFNLSWRDHAGPARSQGAVPPPSGGRWPAWSRCGGWWPRISWSLNPP